jgi:hypothetical protein
LLARECGKVGENSLHMRSANHFTPRKGYFPWSTENIFRLPNTLRLAKYSKIGKTFFRKYFTPKQVCIPHTSFVQTLAHSVPTSFYPTPQHTKTQKIKKKKKKSPATNPSHQQDNNL